MPLDTVHSLVDALRGRSLLKPEQYAELTSKLAKEHTDTQELARALIRRRWITVYQAKKLLSGKADELVIGQYVILDKLGEGGMGKVYKAVQTSLNRVVALKVVRSSLLKSEMALRRFHREVKSAAALSHPNIVRTFDADQIGDRHFLAMEYIEGCDLAKLVKDRGPLPVSVACSYMRQAALGLRHAHDMGMVHRDIKPSNLLVATNDKGQYGARSGVKILDMGLARMQDDPAGETGSTELTRTGTVVGTPDFMSPEQAKNSSQVDHRSDLYSLGCTFYHLLTGEVPFPSGTPLEKLLQHQMDQPRPIQLVRMDVPGEVATIVQCLLAKKPEQRFQSGTALAHALDPWCNGPGSQIQPAMVLVAEAADPTSATLETPPGDPFDFNDDTDPITPIQTRRPPPLPTINPMPTRRRFPLYVWALALSVVFLAIVLIANTLLNRVRSKSLDPVVPESTPRVEPAKPKVEPAPVVPKDLETIEKYLPDDSSLVLVFDLRNARSSAAGRQYIVGPIMEPLWPVKLLTGLDFANTLDRVILSVAGRNDSELVFIAQGRTLVSPKLIETMKSLPGVEDQPAWEGGPEILMLPAGKPDGQINYMAFTETSVIFSANRDRVLASLDKKDGAKRTKLEDATLARGLEHAHAKPFTAFAALACRCRLSKFISGSEKLEFAVAGIGFEERGLMFLTMADESTAGKAAETQKAIGQLLLTKAQETSDQRIERIARLFLDAQAPKNLLGKRWIQSIHVVPERRFDDWFAPFAAKGKG